MIPHPDHDIYDRGTIRVTALVLGALFLACFTLATISMP
jgi:hypothetical protein